MASEQGVRETGLGSHRLQDLGLTITGTPLEGVIEQLLQELIRCGISRLRPHFYLSTEWGVPFDTISIAIPFYLARVDLTRFHSEQVGFIEGADEADLLRYLRHEMGHVVNYAYRLYEQPEWTRHFGDINVAYEEEYRTRPFSRDHVVNLPGWYAQKHPDEDWAETFAVWMTPGLDWRARYASWPALSKLEYCDRVMEDLRAREPLTLATDADESVDMLESTLDEHYRAYALDKTEVTPGLDDALAAIFQSPTHREESKVISKPAGALVRRLERTIAADVYRWTGWFPERSRQVLAQVADIADRRNLTYSHEAETAAAIALTAFITAFAVTRMQGPA